MKTCSKCGCYIPDKWDSCPACKIIIEVNTTTHSRYIDRDSLLCNMHTVLVNYKYSTTPIKPYCSSCSWARNECDPTLLVHSCNRCSLLSD